MLKPLSPLLPESSLRRNPDSTESEALRSWHSAVARVLSTVLLIGRLGVLVVGLSLIVNCGVPLNIEPELEFDTQELEDTGAGAILAQRLRGRWELNTSSITSDCPEEIGHSPIDGFTEWRSVENQVAVEWLDGYGELEMWAVNGETLKAINSIEGYGCEVTQEITLDIQELTSRFISASFFIEYYHNGAGACDMGTAMYDLPDGCDATISWLGYRSRYR